MRARISPARCWQKQEALSRRPPLTPPLLDQVTPQGLSSSDNGVGIAMETSRSPHGDRPGKSPGASHVDLDPGCYAQSETVFFLPKPVLGPGRTGQATRLGLALPALLPVLCHLDLPISGPGWLAPPTPLSFTLKYNKSRAGGGRKL